MDQTADKVVLKAQKREMTGGTVRKINSIKEKKEEDVRIYSHLLKVMVKFVRNLYEKLCQNIIKADIFLFFHKGLSG